MLEKDSIPSGRARWSVLSISDVYFSYLQKDNTIFMFIPFPVTQGTIVHSMTVSLTLWLECSQLIIKRSLCLLVMPVMVTLSGWNRSLLLISMDVMLVIFAMSGCDQLVRCPTHIAGNRLDLVISDAHNMVDVFVGTPLGTSGHCFVSCVLCVPQSVPEHNVTSTAFLKHRTNWDRVGGAVRSFTWSTILKSADLL